MSVDLKFDLPNIRGLLTHRTILGVLILSMFVFTCTPHPNPTKEIEPFRLPDEIYTIYYEGGIAVEYDPVYFDREKWEHWIDEDGDCQDTRQEVLIAESLIPVEFTGSDRCTVASGFWLDRYTGETITDPSDLAIDHTVPLANAFDWGAWNWSEDEKRRYANDLTHEEHLIAVSSSAKLAKGDQSLADWKPPSEAYWCEYFFNWLTIKSRWRLTSTAKDLNERGNMVANCDFPEGTLIRERGVIP